MLLILKSCAKHTHLLGDPTQSCLKAATVKAKNLTRQGHVIRLFQKSTFVHAAIVKYANKRKATCNTKAASANDTKAAFKNVFRLLADQFLLCSYFAVFINQAEEINTAAECKIW
jgi:hypothetical protein